MNQALYDRLLIYSRKLISFKKHCVLNEFDLVHGAWDFKEQDAKKILSNISKHFSCLMRHQHVPFSTFKNKNGEEIPIDLISLKGNRKTKIETFEKQCSECLSVLTTIKFTGRSKLCNSCRSATSGQTYRQTVIGKASVRKSAQKRKAKINIYQREYMRQYRLNKNDNH